MEDVDAVARGHAIRAAVAFALALGFVEFVASPLFESRDEKAISELSQQPKALTEDRVRLIVKEEMASEMAPVNQRLDNIQRLLEQKQPVARRNSPDPH